MGNGWVAVGSWLESRVLDSANYERYARHDQANYRAGYQVCPINGLSSHELNAAERRAVSDNFDGHKLARVLKRPKGFRHPIAAPSALYALTGSRPEAEPVFGRRATARLTSCRLTTLDFPAYIESGPATSLCSLTIVKPGQYRYLWPQIRRAEARMVATID